MDLHVEIVPGVLWGSWEAFVKASGIPGPDASGGYGTVALAEAWARWTHTLGQVSDNESQFSERVGQTEGRTTSVPRS